MILFILVDGLADISLSILNGKTPLEYAKTPAMDALSNAGINGLMDSVESGIACGSDTAHMSILGYEPFKNYRGRGSFEAMGAGLDMKPGDIAFKCNFATMDDKTNIVINRRVDRNFSKSAIELSNYLNNTKLPNFPDISIQVQYAIEHRCVVSLQGMNLTDQITGTDPLKDNLPLEVSKPLNNSKEGKYTSDLINELSNEFRKKLSLHPLNIDRINKSFAPANVLLLRGPSERIKVPSFYEMHQLNAFMIAPTCIIAGIGRSLEIDLIKAPGATGDYKTNLISKAETALHIFRSNKKSIHNNTYNFGFIHIKAVDDAGHDQDIDKKVHWIEETDKMIAKILDECLKDTNQTFDNLTIALTGDHTTPGLFGDHTFEPVPFVIANARLAAEIYNNYNNKTNSNHIKKNQMNYPKDNVTCFSEIDAGKGYLGRFDGSQVIKILKSYDSINKL